MMQTKLIVIILSLLIPLMSRGFTSDQFKKVAHEMVHDLKNAYGSQFIQQQVRFDMDDFHKLIDVTDYLPVEGPLENKYVDQFSGKLMTEKVDAINYFPSEKQIVYNKNIFGLLFDSGKIEELKIMIHHEFIPYFTKAPDRDRQYDFHLRSLYKRTYSFHDIKTGLYYAMRVNNSIADFTNDYIMYSIIYNHPTNELIINHIENPLKQLWCFDCYLYPTKTLYPETPQDFVSKIESTVTEHSFRDIMLGINGEEFENRGYAYLQIFNSETIGFGVMEENFKGSMHEYLLQKGMVKKLFLLTRVKNAEELNWEQKKKVPLKGIFFSADQAKCKAQSTLQKSNIVNLCERIGESGFIVPEAKRGPISVDPLNCRKEEVQLFDLQKNYPNYKCAWLTFLNVPTRTEYTPIPKHEYDQKIAFWNKLKKLHLEFDRIFSIYPDALNPRPF